MQNTTFLIRNGLDNGKLITNDFPHKSRIALFNILCEFIDMRAFSGYWSSLRNEIYRTCRYELVETNDGKHREEVKEALFNCDWYYLYTFIERVYFKLLDDIYEYDINGYPEEVIITKEDVKKRFHNEINLLLSEDNIDFEFIDGEFLRRGRANTQNLVRRVGSVLSDARLKNVKVHYLKGLNFFRNKDNPDFENTIKESICAMELAFEILSGEKSSKDFNRFIKKYSGNDKDKIPAPIVESIIKIFSYRGAGEGIAHGINKGLKVTELEAEMVLSLSASYITYFYDFFTINNKSEDIPF